MMAGPPSVYPEKGMPVNPTEEFNIVAAAREANRTYLNGSGVQGIARKAQEYDQLNEIGRLLWHSVVRCSMYAGARR
jgi:hypothetical protein